MQGMTRGCVFTLFRIPICLRGDGLGDIVIGQASFADDGQLHGGDAVQCAERGGDGAHSVRCLLRRDVAAHEIVGQHDACRAVRNGKVEHLRPVGDGPRQIHGNLAAHKRLKRKQRKLLRIGGADNGLTRGEQAVPVWVIQAHGIFRLVGGRIVQQN